MFYLLGFLLLFSLLVLLFSKSLQLLLDKCTIRIPFKGYLLSCKWNGYLYFKIHFLSWHHIRLILVLSNFRLIIDKALNANVNNITTCNTTQTMQHTRNKNAKLRSILQKITFWKWLECVCIELHNVSLQLNVSETECITFECMNWALNNLSNRNTQHLSHSIIFTCSSFQLRLNNIKCIDFYPLRIHALINIDSIINNNILHIIQGINIKWNGIKFYLNKDTTDYVLTLLQHVQNKQNKQSKSDKDEIEWKHMIPNYVSMHIEYIGIQIMHNRNSAEFGIKSFNTKVFNFNTDHACIDIENSWIIFCDTYSSIDPPETTKIYTIIHIKCQFISNIEHETKHISFYIAESSFHINPQFISWIDYLTQYRRVLQKEETKSVHPPSFVDTLLELNKLNIIIQCEIHNSVLNICDKSEDMIPAYSFSIHTLHIIYTASSQLQHYGHLFVTLDSITFSLAHLITKNISQISHFMLNIIVLNLSNNEEECIGVMFDMEVESVSIGIHHEYISTASDLLNDYQELFLSIRSKLPPKQYRKAQHNGEGMMKTMGQIQCRRFTVFTCFMDESDEVCVRLRLKELQIIKHLCKHYEDEELITPDDLRYIPTTPTLYEWIADFHSFQIMIQDVHNDKRRKLQKTQPLLRIMHSKFEQYVYTQNESIRNIRIGESVIQWNMIQHISICKLFHAFAIHAQALKHKISPFIADKDEQEYKEDAIIIIPTLLSTHSIDIEMKFDHKSHDGTLHIYIDKVEHPSYLTVYRDRFEALNVDIFSSCVFLKDDNVFLPYIVHNDKLLHEAYIECYKQYYNEDMMGNNVSSTPKTLPASPQKSYFQRKRQKSHDGNVEDAMSLNFHCMDEDNWNTFILKHGSFGIGHSDNIIEFDEVKVYHSGKADNAYVQSIADFDDEINEEYYDKNTNQPNLNLSFGVFVFKLPHDCYFGDILLGLILTKWKAFKMWFKYTLMMLPQTAYHVPLTLDFANIIVSAKEFEVGFKEDSNCIKALIAQFVDVDDDVLQQKYKYLNENMNRWCYGKGFNIHNEHDLCMVFENVFRICGDNLCISLELDAQCLTFNDTLKTLQKLDSYQPPIEDAEEPITSVHPWYELWCKHINIKANHVSATISGYAMPIVSTPYLQVNGKLILAQLLCPNQRFIEHKCIDLSPSLSVDMESHEFIDAKFYYDLNVNIFGKESLLTYGKCMEPGIDKLSLCIDRMTKSVKPLKFGKLVWWDKLRMKLHGNIQMDIKHTVICIIKENNIPNYLSIDIDHGLVVSKRAVFSLLAHSVSMQVITIDKFMKTFDIFQVNNICEMYEIPAVNKDHTVARIHFLKITTRCYWNSKQHDPYQHYFHHTYWCNSLLFQDAVPDVDMDLYQRYRAQKLTLKYKIQIKAPTQENTKTKAFLAGLDLRLWWQCKSWIYDLMDKLTEASPEPDKPELGALLEPMTLECSFLYPSVEILHILKQKQNEESSLIQSQDLLLDMDEAMSVISNPSNPCSPSTSKPSTPRKLSKKIKFTARKPKDYVTQSEAQQYTLLGMRVRAKELLFRTKFIRSSQQHPLLDSEIVIKKNDMWLMKGKYLKLSKPKLELIVPSTKRKKNKDKNALHNIFYHVSPFKAENCYGDFEIARFARSAHLVFSDMGYHKAEESVRVNKFKFPRDTVPPQSGYTKYRPSPLNTLVTKNSLPPSPPLRTANHSSHSNQSGIAILNNRTSSVNVLLNTEMLRLDRARPSVDDLESIPSSKCGDLNHLISDHDRDTNELIRSLSEQYAIGYTDSSPDDSMSPIKFIKDEQESTKPKLTPKVRRNSFNLDMASDFLRSPSIFDNKSWDEQPGNATIYDSWVLDDLKLLWNEAIRQTVLKWWPLLFEKAKDDNADDNDDAESEPNRDILQEENENKYDDAITNNPDSNFVSSLSELLQIASNNRKPRIVTDKDDGEGAIDTDKTGKDKDAVLDGRQPIGLEDYKQRLWLVHLQRPQIKFEAIKDAVLVGAHHAFVQGFGFNLELLPDCTKDNVDNIRHHLPPQEMIYRLNNTQFYDDVMPYFKIRICGSLIDAQMFVAPSNIDHVDKWIPTDQLQSKSGDKQTPITKLKTQRISRSKKRRRSINTKSDTKIKKDFTIKAVVGHCKLQFAYSYDLDIPKTYAHKIVPFHWRSFAENDIISDDYDTQSFVPNTSVLNAVPLLNRNKMHVHVHGNITSPTTPPGYSAHSFASEPFSKLFGNNSISVTPSSSQHTFQQNTFFLPNPDDDNDNNNHKDPNHPMDTKPAAYTEWIGRQHVPFIDEYKSDPTSNIKVYLPSFVGKLDPYQFQTFLNVINFVLLASHQSDEQMNDELLDKHISITKQQRQRIQRELHQTVNKSFDSSKHCYSVHKTPLKIVEYQANSISWKMADTNGNTFLNTEITNCTGTHTLCSDLSREADVELQHFQVTQSLYNNNNNNNNNTLSASLSPSKANIVRSRSFETEPKSASESSLTSDSASSNHKTRKKKKNSKRNKFIHKSQQIINNILNSRKSRSISPLPHYEDTATDNDDEITVIAIGEQSPEFNPNIVISELKQSVNQCTKKIMIQPQPEPWKRFENNAIKQRSRRMMLTIRADNAKPYHIKSCFGDKKINIPLYRHLEVNLFPVKIDLDLDHAKQLRDYFFIVTENETKNRNAKQHKQQFLNYFEKQHDSDNSHSTLKSFSFSDYDQTIGETLMLSQQQQNHNNMHNEGIGSPHSSTNSVKTSDSSNSLSNQKYFHRIRIGRLSFDVSFTGWVKDIHKDISVSTFIYSNRLSTWTKLIQSLGSHAFRDVVFGSVTNAHLNPLQLDNLSMNKKKKKIFETLNDTAKRQRLLFGKSTHNACANNDEYVDETEIPMDAICMIEVVFDRYCLIKMLTQNDYASHHGNDDDDDDDELQYLLRDALMVQLIHDRLVLELRTVLEHVHGSNNLLSVFEFQVLNKITANCWKLKILLRKIGEFETESNEMDEFDLIEKYRICAQSLIVAKYDTKQHKTNHNLSSIIKYLYNAKNITIQPIKAYLN